MRLPSARYYATWIAVLRIVLGSIWLAHGVPKFLQSAQFMPPTGFMPTAIAESVKSHSGFYHDFLLNVVTPHAAIFAELVRLGEVLVGLSLLFGLLTRLGALGGVFLALNYYFLNNPKPSFGSLGTLDFATLVLSAVIFVLPAGRMLGVDALLGRKRPEPALVPEFVDEPVATVPVD
ncbi:MAG: DoxX family membrane protein [Candidatus Eremiobacteraeota bacterium]|nr:DoxX family membrane protein [Candidatus Eremiobacteraeota bacterium]